MEVFSLYQQKLILPLAPTKPGTCAVNLYVLSDASVILPVDVFKEISEPTDVSVCVKITIPLAVNPLVCCVEREPLINDATTAPTDVPEEPDVPELPVPPLVPDVPEEPFIPDVPLDPLEPDVPDVPLEPDVPELPLEPDVPLDPLLPLVPEDPLEPDVPDEPTTAKLATVIFLVDPPFTIGITSFGFGLVSSVNWDIF